MSHVFPWKNRRWKQTLLALLVVALMLPTSSAFAHEPPPGAPAVAVADQAYGNGTVTVGQVVSNGPGWIVIHAQKDGSFGPVIGHAAVTDGVNENVTVEIDTSAATDTLYAMLHTDAGEMGAYEFPGADTPVTANGAIVMQPFVARADLTPGVSVADQDVVGGAIVVDEVVSDGPGWIVIHAQKDGSFGPVIGHAAVTDGVNPNVVVSVDSDGVTDTLYAMLHTDAGEMGVYEFPGADTPVMVDDEIAMHSFAVTAQQVIVQAPALPGAQPISARDRVYTADQSSNTITVINPATNEVLGTIALGEARLDGVLGPVDRNQVNVHGLGFSANGRSLDVIDVTSNAAQIIDTATNRVLHTAYVGRSPHEGFLSPDGSQLWVTVRGEGEIAVIDVASGATVDRIHTLDGPSKVLFSPDGSTAFVNHLFSNELTFYDVTNRTIVERVAIPAEAGGSSDMAISPDGEEIWLGHPGSGKTTVVNVPAAAVEAVVDTGPRTNHPQFVTTENGSFAYVTVGDLNQTKIYLRSADMSAPELVDTIDHTGVAPHGIWPSPDNSRVYVALQKSDAVDVIDTATNEIIATLAVGQDPQALVYVANAAPIGTANLGQQGLGQRVENLEIAVQGVEDVAYTNANIRALPGLEEIDVRVRGLPANSTFTVYGTSGDTATPLLDITSDGNGAVGEALAFAKFFDNYDGLLLAPQGEEVMMGGAMTPSVTVADQAVENGAVTVGQVVSDGPGWIVIHAQKDGSFGPVIGHGGVADGVNENVTVEIDASAATDTLYAMLHTDAGEMGAYEFPGADTPVKVDDAIVMQPFRSGEGSASSNTDKPVEVMLSGFAFNPAALTVAPGATVVWRNQDGAIHTVTAADGSFDSGDLRKGNEFSLPFAQPGTYPVYCIYHGTADGTGMAATVTVQ